MALILTSIGIIGGLFLSMAIHLIDVNAIKFLFTMDGIIDESQTYTLLQYFYWSTYQHISSYLIGILLGFIIQKYDKININSTVQNLLTILFSIGFFCDDNFQSDFFMLEFSSILYIIKINIIKINSVILLLIRCTAVTLHCHFCIGSSVNDTFRRIRNCASTCCGYSSI